MTKEEVSEYIYDNKIPVSFSCKGVVYYLFIYTGDYITSTHPEATFLTFPNWKKANIETEISYWNRGLKFLSRKHNLKDCLTNFLYWFELNKHKYTNIIYYK